MTRRAGGMAMAGVLLAACTRPSGSVADTDPGYAPSPASARPEEAGPARATSSASPPGVSPPDSEGTPPNPWTTPVDCAREISRERSALTPDGRERERANCELKEELRAFVAARQACRSAADCTNVTGSCPFGCTVPVALGAKADVEQKLASLVERQEKAGGRCVYKCAAPAPPVCVAGRCAAP